MRLFFEFFRTYVIINRMRVTNRPLKRTESLRFKFTLIFLFYSIFILALSGFTTYENQMKSYKAMRLDDLRDIGFYLEKMIQDSANEFISYQKYYMEHFAEVDIPYDFTEYHTAQMRMQQMLLKSEHADFINSSDFDFESLSDDEKKAYFIYCHEYWTLVFEHAREAFDLPYTYYLVPKADEYKMVYMIDGERSHKGADGKKSDRGDYLYLGDEYYDAPEKYPVQWMTWFSGQIQNEFQVWNNDWGNTFAYYIPLIIDGQKLGLIGIEVEVKKINKKILNNTLLLLGSMTIGLFLLFIILIFFIDKRYVQKVVNLENDVRNYADDKNPEIASQIIRSIHEKNEISMLAYQFADMIIELEQYMNSLLSTSRELKNTKERANRLNELAIRDSLTGVRNKTAYDREILLVENEIAQGNKSFGLVMIDLNNLKKINDTYGHTQGNIAIKKLCEQICAVFVHSAVFRIGGDEFVVIVKNYACENVAWLVERLNTNLDALADCEELEDWERVGAAVGYAVFDDKIDDSMSSVFKRADQAMYRHKRAMKVERE